MSATTLRTATLASLHTLVLLASFASLPNLASAQALKAMTYKGCYSSSRPLTDQGSYIYQTSGYCQPICVDQGQSVLGLSGGSDCWCGNQLPPEDTLVDDSKCDSSCNGYRQENCGGNGFYSIYLTGTTEDVSNVGSNSGSSSSSSSDDSDSDSTSTTSEDSTPTSTTAPTVTTPPSTTEPATTAQPSVITSIAPGTTIVVTQPASPEQTLSSTTPSPTPSSSDSSPNVAGIAAGVVVGVLALAALAFGAWFLIRRKRKQAAEREFERSNQVGDFMAAGGGGQGMSQAGRAPGTGYSTMSDQRLDPEVGRRNSVGSIADNEDYSRRILRVANPDRG